MATIKCNQKKLLDLIALLLIFFCSNISVSQWQSTGSVNNIGNFPSVFVFDENTIFIVGGNSGSGPIIWRSTNGGINFVQLPANGLPGSSSNRFLTCVCATSVNTIYVGDGSTQGNGIVNNAKVYKTTNGGQNWTTILSSGSNVNGFINGIVFSRTNPLIGVVNCDPNSPTDNFKMWKTTDGGNNWTLYQPGAPNSSGAQNSVFLVDGNFYGFGLNTATARVAITTNGGTNFGYYNLSGAGGSNGFVSSVAFNNNKLNGIACTDATSDSVARTTNGGVNWFAQYIPSTITGFSCVKWIPETNTAYVVVSSSSAAQCLKTTDNGLTWTAFTFPSGTGSIKHINMYIDEEGDVTGQAHLFAASSSGTIYSLNDSPLPVKLMSFNYNVFNRDIILNWATSNEQNNSGFEIQRMINNNDKWENIGFIKGSGTCNTYHTYNFTDKNLNIGKYNYRLKQIDFNGNYEFFNLSGIVEIGNPVKMNLSQNYPNPFNPSTNISYQITNYGLVTLKIYDITGKEIISLVNKNQEAGYYTVNFDAGNLAGGIYFYKLTTKEYSSVKKMTLIK